MEVIRYFWQGVRIIWYSMFPTWIILERKFVSYLDASRMINESSGKPAEDKWVLDTEKEDGNSEYGMVYLCRKKRRLQ
jgi:hypothetical protein